MPKMGGLLLLEKLKAINPHIRAIITTGYALDSRVTHAIARDHLQCLKKPYTREELANTIAQTISHQPESLSRIRANAR
jgi:two-component system cell cycle sensor histidine kinase/response regulator CckA